MREVHGVGCYSESDNAAEKRGVQLERTVRAVQGAKELGEEYLEAQQQQHPEIIPPRSRAAPSPDAHIRSVIVL